MYSTGNDEQTKKGSKLHVKQQRGFTAWRRNSPNAKFSSYSKGGPLPAFFSHSWSPICIYFIFSSPSHATDSQPTSGISAWSWRGLEARRSLISAPTKNRATTRYRLNDGRAGRLGRMRGQPDPFMSFLLDSVLCEINTANIVFFKIMCFVKISWLLIVFFLKKELYMI